MLPCEVNFTVTWLALDSFLFCSKNVLRISNISLNVYIVENNLDINKALSVLKKPVAVRERSLRATWATIAAPTSPSLPAVAVHEPTLLFVTELRSINEIKEPWNWHLKSENIS